MKKGRLKVGLVARKVRNLNVRLKMFELMIHILTVWLVKFKVGVGGVVAFVHLSTQ